MFSYLQRKTHFMFSSCCMLFPTFLENNIISNIFRKQIFPGGCWLLCLLAGDLGRPRLPCVI